MKLILFFILSILFACTNTELADENKPSPSSHSLIELPQLEDNFVGTAEAVDISHDSNYISVNSTDLSVTLILENWETKEDTNSGLCYPTVKNNLPTFSFGEQLRGDGILIEWVNQRYIGIANTVFLTFKETHLREEPGLFNGQTVPIMSIGNTTENLNEMTICEKGNVTLKLDSLTCMDTGIHMFKLETETGMLLMKNLANVEIFEYDLSGDKIKELYIVSYTTCLGHMSIFRIE